MKLSTVRMIDEVDWKANEYDFALFASGYESRSTYVAETLPRGNYRSAFVLGFSSELDTMHRKANDLYFSSAIGERPHICLTSGIERLFERMILSARQSNDGKIKIAVDYSVMSRVWYASVLAYLNHFQSSTEVVVDFFYSIGRYKGIFEPLMIQDVGSLPGFEGSVAGMRQSFSIFGLGFDKYATLAVLDRLEPDDWACLVAWDTDSGTNSEHTVSENNLILRGKPRLDLPLSNVEAAFRAITEYVASVNQDTQISLVPMGPKPHVLACLLAATRLPRAACLHARGSRAEKIDVSAAGRVSVSRVTYVPSGDCNDKRN